jgi:hypothetical protein
MMGESAEGIVLRGKSYSVRLRTPKELVGEFGGQVWRALGTQDWSVALKAAPSKRAEIRAMFDAARLRRAQPEVDRRLMDARQALWTWAERYGTQMVATDASAGPESPWEVVDLATRLDRAWREPEGWRDVPDFIGTVGDMLRMGGFKLRHNDPVIMAVRSEAALIWSHAIKGAEQRRREAAYLARAAEVRAMDTLDVAVAPPKPAKALPTPALRLSELHRRWMDQLQPAEKERGRLDHQSRRLIEAVGDIPVNHLTREQVADFMGLVARFPGRKRPADLNALPMLDLVERFEREQEEREEAGEEPWGTLTKTTAGEWFAAFKREFAFAVDVLEVQDRNPWEKMAFVVKGGESIKRRAFTDDELATLAAALATECSACA